jgi:hypothetical protein
LAHLLFFGMPLQALRLLPLWCAGTQTFKIIDDLRVPACVDHISR